MVTSNECPSLYPVALHGRPWNVDMREARFRSESIPLLRNQADTGSRPGEQSINTEDLWRRTVESWHHGAGQTRYDAADSDPARFRSSLGLDVWTPGQLSQMKAVELLRSMSSPLSDFIFLATVGTRLYVSEGDDVYFSDDLVTFASIAGLPGGQDVTAMTTDGQNVYVTQNTAVYSKAHPTGNFATYATGAPAAPTVLGHVNGRLMAAAANVLYNITAAGAWPAALHTHPLTGFRWVGFAEGTTHLYAAGFINDKSNIYKITVQPDGTALTVPTLAAPGLPDGEIITAIYSYLGYVLIGSNLGVRLAAVGSDGNLTYGGLIPIAVAPLTTVRAVRCFEAQDRFVWFGWENLANVGTESGLGRLDLSVFTAPLTPAYATDLTCSSNGKVTGVVTVGGRRVFTVGAIGTFIEATSNVLEFGNVEMGEVTYGLADLKVLAAIDVKHRASTVTGGRYEVKVRVENGTYVATSASTTDPASGGGVTITPTTLPVGRTLEPKLFTYRISEGPSAQGVIITSMTLRSQPIAANRGETFTVPLIITNKDSVGSTTRNRDPAGDMTFLRDLLEFAGTVEYQDGTQVWNVFVEDLTFIREKPTSGTGAGTFFQGICLVKLKRVG